VAAEVFRRSLVAHAGVSRVAAPVPQFIDLLCSEESGRGIPCDGAGKCAERTRTAAIVGRKYRLLLVEDDRAALIAGAHQLEDAGFVVEPAKTAADAIVKANAVRHDVIVTDLVIPNLIKPCLPTAIGAKARRLLAVSSREAGIRVFTGYAE